MINQANSITVKIMLKMLKTVHLFLMIGVVVFMFVVSTLLTDPKAPKIDEAFDFFKFIVPTLAVFAILGAYFIGNFMLSKGEHKSFGGKLRLFQTTMIVQMALYELVAIFAIVSALLSNAHIFFSVVLIMLVMMFLLKPTKEKIASKLHLDENEKDLLNDDNYVIID